jgi:hypothetical protein
MELWGGGIFFHMWKDEKFVQFLVRNPEVKRLLWRCWYDERIALK